MTLWLLLSLGILCLVGAIASGIYSTPYRRSDWWCALALVLGLAALLLILFPTIILGNRAIGRTTCHNFSKQTGYPTRFVLLNWADSGTCLARTPDGHWTQNTNIIVNVPARP